MQPNNKMTLDTCSIQPCVVCALALNPLVNVLSREFCLLRTYPTIDVTSKLDCRLTKRSRGDTQVLARNIEVLARK